MFRKITSYLIACLLFLFLLSCKKERAFREKPGSAEINRVHEHYVDKVVGRLWVQQEMVVTLVDNNRDTIRKTDTAPMIWSFSGDSTLQRTFNFYEKTSPYYFTLDTLLSLEDTLYTFLPEDLEPPVRDWVIWKEDTLEDGTLRTTTYYLYR